MTQTLRFLMTVLVFQMAFAAPGMAVSPRLDPLKDWVRQEKWLEKSPQTVGEIWSRVRPNIPENGRQPLDQYFQRYLKMPAPSFEFISRTATGDRSALILSNKEHKAKIEWINEEWAVLAVNGDAFTQKEFREIGKLIPQLEDAIMKSPKHWSSLFFPEAQAWMWPVAVGVGMVAIALAVYFGMDKGTENMSNTQHNVDVSAPNTTHTVHFTGIPENFQGNISMDPNSVNRVQTGVQQVIQNASTGL